MDKGLHQSQLPQVILCYLDDILITGRNDQEHLAHLEEVLERLKEWGLRLKKSKCYFMQFSQNQQQLRAFLGLVNYYGKFLRAFSTTARPLNQLLKNSVSSILFT